LKITKRRLAEIIKEEVEAAVQIDEGHTRDMRDMPYERNIDKEGSMAKNQLMRCGKYAYEMMDMLSDEDQLPSWLQSKITLAAQYLYDAHSKLVGDSDVPNEPKEDDESYKKEKHIAR
jgi:hypothetical protein